MRGIKLLLAISVLIFACFIALAALYGVYGWIPDIIAYIILFIFLCKTCNFWRLNPLILTGLVFGAVLHCCGGRCHSGERVHPARGARGALARG